MANFDFNETHGKIKRLYPDVPGLYLTVGGAGSQTAMLSSTVIYYLIPRAHANYDALVDLVYLCAQQGWKLQIRTQPAPVGNAAQVIYLVVDFTP